DAAPTDLGCVGALRLEEVERCLVGLLGLVLSERYPHDRHERDRRTRVERTPATRDLDAVGRFALNLPLLLLARLRWVGARRQAVRVEVVAHRDPRRAPRGGFRQPTHGGAQPSPLPATAVSKAVLMTPSGE